MIEFGMEVQEAGKAPRASHNEGEVGGLEDGIDPKVAAELEDMGHSTKELGSMGGNPAIRIDWEREILLGGAAPQKDCATAGC